jgi:tRNA(Arg) A34 adenosine deaminase TadA
VNNPIFNSPFSSSFGAQLDIIFMDAALEQAEIAAEQSEVPVGAVVIDEKGAIIARAYNQVEHTGTQRAHAEMLALEQAALSRGNWRLSGCWLYVTLEPCTMCMGLARLSRVAGVVYGARSPLMGYSLHEPGVLTGSGSGESTFDRSLTGADPKEQGGQQAEKRELENRGLYKGIEDVVVVRGVQAEKAELVLKKFFKKRRT